MRDTTIEEDLEKEWEDESQNQHTINLLVHDCHPWEEQMGLRGNEAKGIIASVNSFRREDVQKYFDEVTHVELPAKLVKGARAEELEYFNTLPVWKVLKTQECWDVTSKPPISTKGVDVNKGDQREYDIRCRLMSRQMGGS